MNAEALRIRYTNLSHWREYNDERMQIYVILYIDNKTTDIVMIFFVSSS